MTIYTKKVMRFTRPLSPDKVAQIQAGDIDALAPTGTEYFLSKRDEFQEAPEWIKTNKMFEWGQKDGDLMVIEKPVVVPGLSGVPSEEVNVPADVPLETSKRPNPKMTKQ